MKRYKKFLEPRDTTRINRRTFSRWMKRAEKGNKGVMQNDQTAGTSSDIVQISSIDSLSTENEDICTLNEIAHDKEPHNTTPSDILLCNNNNDVSSLNKIVYDKNNCDCDSDECNEDTSCDDQSDNDDVICEDYFDLFDVDSSDINDNTNDNTIMFEAAGLSICQVFTMVQALCLRFNHSDESRHALLNLIKILAGPKYSYINTSKYTMSKWYNPPANKMLYIYYCTECYIPLLNPLSKDRVDQKKTMCIQCKKKYNISPKSSNYFISIDVEHQIRALLEHENVRNILINKLANVNTTLQNSSMSDVHDSLLYKNIAQNQGCKVLTFNFNTDGFPVFKSSKNSIWPLSLIINEIPPKCRFQTLILAGLWVSKSEPKPKFMNLYLKFFIQQMEKLMNDGITILNSNNEKIKFVLRPLSASVDSVARPIIQNRIQFNGYYGCSWCYDKGVYAHGSMRYPFTESESLRSHENYLKDINEAKRMQRPINGVKGASILTTFKHFDCVWGFPVDYLHGILGGVVRQLWTEWNCPSSPFYLSRKQRQKIDQRLLNIKPPQEIHRLPRSFNEGKLKASEWRSWLLFYSVPCLTEILNDKALASFTRLVQSVYILLSQNISEENFKQCENDLIQFVGESEILYGKSVMTFNMHSLLHVVDSVRMSGPLWATSTFPYENDNFHLKQNVSGPNGVLHQIATKTLQRSRLKNAVINENKTDTCTIYCQGLFNPRKLVMQNTITVCGAVLIGEITGFEDIKSLVKETLGFENDQDIVRIYNRCIYRGTIFHSTMYERPKRSNDTVVQLQSSTIVEISNFIYFKDECYITVNEYSVQPIFNFNHIMRVQNNRNSQRSLKVVPLNSIKCKIVYVDVIDHVYICTLPNAVEIQ